MRARILIDLFMPGRTTSPPISSRHITMAAISCSTFKAKDLCRASSFEHGAPSWYIHLTTMLYTLLTLLARLVDWSLFMILALSMAL